ncbi:MAG: SufB/SufD family protein [Spirochaetia bacterium]
MTLSSYFQQFQENPHMPLMPDARSEEFRYSRIIDALHNLEINPNNKSKLSEFPWKTDCLFVNNQECTTCKKIAPKEMGQTFLRAKNYFKDASFVSSPWLYHIKSTQKDAVLSLGFASSTQEINNAKIFIQVAAESSLTLHIHTSVQAESLMMPMIFVQAEKDTKVDIFYWPESQYQQGILYPFFETSVEENSQINFYSFSKDLLYHRLNFYGYILGPHADISLHTSFYLKEKEHADFFARIFHESSESTSNQHINTVAHGESCMNFNGQIAANQSAKQILAYQMFKGLLLGDKARITARPQLDIEYYDLACSHGVSIGGFTQEEIFYMKNRGLKDSQIYPLLTYGFLTEPFIELEKEGAWRVALKEELSIS